MITIYGAGENISYEEVGAIELLKSQGVALKVLLPEKEGDVGLHSARTILSQFGVDVELYTLGALKKSKVVVSFGRPELFDLMRSSGERPGKVLYRLQGLSATASEVRAVSKGLVDEIFVSSPRRAASTVRELVKKANRGVEFRQGYLPFCNPDSDFCKLYFSERKSPTSFVILRDTPDRAEYADPDYWATVACVTGPMELEKWAHAVGWGKNLTRVAGSPLGQSFFGKQLFAEIQEVSPALDKLHEVYEQANVLLHFFPADDVFSFGVARAMLTGVVVVGPPLPAFTDMLQHGETGFLARSSDEAAYYASQVAWEPQLRLDVASKAYNWVVTKGPGNPDNCLPWWRPVIEWT
jgi:hypothetical protein